MHKETWQATNVAHDLVAINVFSLPFDAAFYPLLKNLTLASKYSLLRNPLTWAPSLIGMPLRLPTFRCGIEDSISEVREQYRFSSIAGHAGSGVDSMHNSLHETP